MLILFYFWLIFALAIVPNNELTLLFMVKVFNKVLDVLPTLTKGRFSVVLDGELYVGSRQTLFMLAGPSCVALQLCIPFVFD